MEVSMRAWQLFGVVVLAGVVSVPSYAGKKKSEPATETAAADQTKADVEMVIKPTGVADVDAVYAKAEAPLGTVKSVRAHITDMRTHMTTALGLADGTPIADALADLDQKAGDTIMVTMNSQGLPQLKPSDAVPANVQSAVDAFNTGMVDIQKSAENLGEIPGQLKEIMVAASAIDTDSLTQSGVSATAIPKAMKTVDHNNKVLRSATTEVEAIRGELDAMRTTVQAVFKSS
jgi:hypothetical protein